VVAVSEGAPKARLGKKHGFDNDDNGVVSMRRLLTAIEMVVFVIILEKLKHRRSEPVDILSGGNIVEATENMIRGLQE